MFTVLTRLSDFRPRYGNREEAILSRLPAGRAQAAAARPGIKCVLWGEEVYRVSGQVFTVRAGEFLLVDAAQELDVEVTGRDETVGLCIDIPAYRLREAMAARLGHLDGAPALSGVPNIVSAMPGTILGTVLERLGRTALGKGGEAVPLEAVTGQLAAYILSLHGRQEQISARRPSVRLELLRRAERARSYLHAHPARPVPLDELAAASALSKFHLSRTFRQIYGVTPGAYHTRLRVSAARKVLASERVPLSEVALRFGFADAASFSRAFRRIHGTPPGAHRAPT